MNNNVKFKILNIKIIFELFRVDTKIFSIIFIFLLTFFLLNKFEILNEENNTTFFFFSITSLLMLLYGTSFAKHLLLKITGIEVFYTSFFNENLFVNISNLFITKYRLNQINIKNKTEEKILLINQIFDLSNYINEEKSKKIMANISLVIAINQIAENKGLIYFISLFVYVLMANVLFNFSIMLIVPFNEFPLNIKLICLFLFTIGFILTLAWFLKIYINVLIEEIEHEMFKDILLVNAKIEEVNQKDLIEYIYKINQLNLETKEVKLISFPQELSILKSTTLNYFNDISKTLIQMAAPITYLAMLNILFSVYQ